MFVKSGAAKGNITSLEESALGLGKHNLCTTSM